MRLIRLTLCLLFLLIFSSRIFSQKDITPVFPADGSVNVNKAVLQWSGAEGVVYDIYFGLSTDPKLFKADIAVSEIKPVVIELNKKYYWKIVEKKDGKIVRTSRVFNFSTLPVKLSPSVKYNSLIDQRDDKIYWTTTINGNEWFAQNLEYDLKNQSWYYENSEANKVYGKLYSGQALKTNIKDICPAGWHIPERKEWMDLTDFTGGYKVAGTALKETSDLFWRASKNQRTNSSGMSVLPAGSRDSKPDFSNSGKYTFFWSATTSPKANGFYTIDLGFMRDNVIFSDGDPDWSYSIRCIKDK